MGFDDQSGFRSLRVWQRSMDGAQMIHRESKKFPRDELFGLTSQIRRAAYSVPLNIAEGYKRRKYKRDYLKALRYAHGSEGEVETAVELAVRFQYWNKELGTQIMKVYDEVGGMLSALITRIEKDIEGENEGRRGSSQ